MSGPLSAVLVAVPVVVLACQAGGWTARRLGQPPVIGEMAIGILLGPSLLGWLAPGVQHLLLPPAVLPYISVLGNLALLVFLFVIGLELDLGSLRATRRAVASVAAGSILLPLALGAGLALAMYPSLAPDGVHQWPFVLFIATALSITAFPVLARILTDKGLATTLLGTFALACAAADDALAWCLLIAVTSLATAGSPLDALCALALAAALTAALSAARPLVKRTLERAARTSDDLVTVLLVTGLLLAAYATDWIGVHPAIGAFLAGATMPRAVQAVERSAARLHAVVVPVLLPLFFVDIGLHTDVAALQAGQWGWAALVLAVAVTGKWVGAAGAARLTGCDWRWSALMGTLMNCRGITEIVVLSIGLQLGVITTNLFTIMVVMAVATTAATTPLLDRLTRNASDLTAPSPASKPVRVLPENHGAAR
ncbi:cation:proton antiporter [Streptomyces sp. Go40/10]|uniref:cation:proton antiporter n=1 Tax=Streptomyces sp. Go40/10 TaxID=2825844 RepID=UPI001E423C52|nr:cation:proton antiporter [Streptomyces sp. Go40/10]UFQ99798.1 cation:proton antiporter [Streptomyces sp. Go40/10]